MISGSFGWSICWGALVDGSLIAIDSSGGRVWNGLLEDGCMVYPTRVIVESYTFEFVGSGRAY